MAVTPTAFFLPAGAGGDGQRFCLYFEAQARAPRGAVVYVHPFADEMNKSRRMVSLQARALSEAGFAVLQIDLHGCGDSSGDFGDAGWDDWVDDVCMACSWLRQRSDAPLWLWGLRAGCLLAVEAARRVAGDCRFLFWQPTVSGRQLLQQFLRFKAAGDLTEGNAREVMAGLRRQLADGQPVDVVGYRLSPRLAAGLERAELSPVAGARRLEWIELSSRADASLTPVALKQLDAWRHAGCAARGQVASGPPFWQTIDIEEAPDLLSTTTRTLCEADAQRP